MTLDLYKEVNLKEEKVKDILSKNSGQNVIIKDSHSGNILTGGILQFNLNDPEVYYLHSTAVGSLHSETVQKRYFTNDLEQLIIVL